MALLRASLLTLCLLACACRAEAADARLRFAIPRKPYAEALIDLAVQANVTLLGASACGTGATPPLYGDFTVSEALTLLLARAPCIGRVVAPGAVRVSPQATSQIRPASPAVTTVSEVMVTAARRLGRLDDLPAGVSVISGEHLRASNAGDVRDTAGQLVGVLMTNLGPGRDKLLMRGLSDGAFTGRARSTVTTYLGETPINDNAPDPDLRLTDIDRVETIRGPQGALYGSGAIAGVYRIVPNKPDPNALDAGLGLSTATTKGGSPSRVAEGFLNAPLLGGRAALRLVAYYDVRGGYIDNLSLRLSNVDSTTRTGARAALGLALSDTWTLDIAATGQRLHSRDTQYTTPGGRAGQRANRVRESHVNDFTQLAIDLSGDLGFARLRSSTAYLRHDYGSLYDATATASQFSPSGAADLGIYSERTRIGRLVQDLVITSTGSGRFSWLAGAFGSAARNRTPAFLDVQPMTGPLIAAYTETRKDRLNEVALYGEGNWRLGPSLTVTVGARAFQTWMHVDSTIVGAPPAQSRSVRLSRTFPGVSPKLSVQYQFPSGALLYGLYSEGFRPGGVNTTNFVGVQPVRITFKSDRLQNFELGAKGHLLDNRLTLRTAAFFDRWTNLQSDQYRASGLAYTANVGDAHITGLEAEAAYAWDFGLRLAANGLFSTPKFTNTNPNFARQLGSHLPGAPHVSGGILARYDRPLTERLSLRMTAQAGYVGRARLTFDPMLSQRTDPVIDTDLAIDLLSRHWSAGVFFNNPTDASSNTFTYGNPFTFGQVRQITPQRPRTIGLRLAAAL